MPVYRIIGKKWSAQQKIVQTVESGKGLRSVLPPLSRKLQIPSMKHYDAFAVNNDKLPVMQLDLDMPLEQQGVGSGDYIFVAPQDSPPSLPDGRGVPKFSQSEGRQPASSESPSKQQEPILDEPTSQLPSAPPAAPPPPTSKLPPPPSAAPPPPTSKLPPQPLPFGAGDASSSMPTEFGRTVSSPECNSGLSTFHRIRSFGPDHASEVSKRRHVVQLPGAVDDVTKGVLQRLETAVLRELPDSVEDYLLERLTRETGLPLPSFGGAGASSPGKESAAQTSPPSPSNDTFQRIRSFGPDHASEVSKRRHVVQLPGAVDDVTKGVLQRLETAVLRELPDSVEDYLLERLTRETGLSLSPARNQPPSVPLRPVACPVSRAEAVSDVLPAGPAVQPAVVDIRRSSPSPTRVARATRSPMLSTGGCPAPSERSPRELLSPPDARVMGLGGDYQLYQRLKQYEHAADPVREMTLLASRIGRGMVSDVDVAHAKARHTPYSHHHASSPPNTAPAHQAYESDAARRLQYVYQRASASPQSAHDQAAKKEQDAMALRYEFDEMLRREAQKNMHLQREVAAMRAHQATVGASASDCNAAVVEHRLRMLAIEGAEASARAHGLAQRRLIELAAKGQHLAQEIERRSSPQRGPVTAGSQYHHLSKMTESQRLQLELSSVRKQQVLYASNAAAVPYDHSPTAWEGSALWASPTAPSYQGVPQLQRGVGGAARVASSLSPPNNTSTVSVNVPSHFTPVRGGARF